MNQLVTDETAISVANEMMANDAEYIMFQALQIESLNQHIRELNEYVVRLLQWWARERPEPPSFSSEEDE